MRDILYKVSSFDLHIVLHADEWVFLNGRVLNVAAFSSQHLGGELAILACAGKDAAAEFDMTHPPDVIEKYASDAVIGVDGGGKAKKVSGAPKSALSCASDKGDADANLEAGGYRRRAMSPRGGSSIVRECLLLIDSQHHLWRGSLCQEFCLISRLTEHGLHEVPFS